jgi:diadenosine tetraphosphate (Ap4A) HIT family hydrolase
MDCPFCAMPAEQMVLENEHAKAFFDKYPVQKGHLLIVPKRHIANYFEATEKEILAIHRLLQEGKGRLDQEFAPDGYNIGVNVGLYGGQTVMHLHVHLIPRYKGDVADPRGGIRKAIPNLVPYPPEEKETNHADLYAHRKQKNGVDLRAGSYCLR